MKSKKTTSIVRKNKLSKFSKIFNFTTTQGRFIIFILFFSIIGGGYMAFQSLAATSSGGKFVFDEPGGTYSANFDGTNRVRVGPRSLNGLISVPLVRHSGGNFVGIVENDGSSGKTLGKVYTIDGQQSYQFGVFGDCNVAANTKTKVSEMSFRNQLSGSLPRLVYIQHDQTSTQPSCTGEDYAVKSSQIVAIDSNGQTKNVVSIANRYYRDIKWSPDGRVYYSDCDLFQTSCKLVYFINGKTTVLLNDSLYYSLSGNGKKLIYISKADSLSIGFINSDGTGKKNIVTNTHPKIIYPGSMSGAGSTFVYSQFGFLDDYEIRMARTDTTSKSVTYNSDNKVVDDSYIVRGVVWSPANDMVMYSKWDTKSSLIARMSADGSTKTRVISYPDHTASIIGW